MPEPQLSVRSARARDLAHELARREGRTVAESSNWRWTLIKRTIHAMKALRSSIGGWSAVGRKMSTSMLFSLSIATTFRRRSVIFIDTNVISELMRKAPDPGVIDWFERHDAELALSTIVIGEIAFGIAKVRPEPRSRRLASDFHDLRRRYADRIFGFNRPPPWRMAS